MTTTSAHIEEPAFSPVPTASATAPSIVVERVEGAGSANRHTKRRAESVEQWLSLHGDMLLLAMVDMLAVARVTSVHGRRLETLVAFLAVTFCVMSPLYRFRPQLSLLDDLPRLITRVMAAVTVGVTAQAVVRSVVDIRRLVLAGVQVLAVLVLTRLVTYPLVRYGRRAGCFRQPTLILGGGRGGACLASVLRDHPEYGLAPVGILAADSPGSAGSWPVPRLGAVASLPAVLEEHGVRRVVAQQVPGDERELGEVLRSCAAAHAELLLVPRLPELAAAVTTGTHAWGLPLVPLRGGAFASPTWRLKRAFDVALSGAALVILSPLLLACAVAVLIESGRPVLFGQERVGVNGKLFELLKFRSLRPVSSVQAASEWTISDESRLGPVGRLLRRSSLDELPQLWNVLVGHMSLVGPRPERPHFVNEFSTTYDHYQDRHRVPVGMTGLAQVHGLRGDTSIEDRVRFDNYYIEAWSLWGDLKILMRTAVAVFTRPGS